jgi:hypothetical protein
VSRAALAGRPATARGRAAERDRGVDELIELVAAVDTITQSQATQQGRIAKALAPILC